MWATHVCFFLFSLCFADYSLICVHKNIFTQISLIYILTRNCPELFHLFSDSWILSRNFALHAFLKCNYRLHYFLFVCLVRSIESSLRIKRLRRSWLIKDFFTHNILSNCITFLTIDLKTSKNIHWYVNSEKKHCILRLIVNWEFFSVLTVQHDIIMNL